MGLLQKIIIIETMPAKLLVNILKVGVFASFLCMYLVFKNLLFPFITSKQIPFNMLLEILAFFWIWLVLQYPEWRPKRSFVTYGLYAFFGVTLLTCFTGVDFNLSFWGDIERMLGWFHIAHFLLLYLIIITVFRTPRDWYYLFIGSVAAAVFESILVITGGTNYGTFGNTEYVAGYMIFNMYFALMLFFWEKNRWLKGVFLLSIIPQMYAFKLADISSATVGLAASIIFVLFLYGVLSKKKIMRWGTIGASAAIFLFIVSLFAFPAHPVRRASPAIDNIVSGIDFKKNTFQTRLISWKTAWYDWKNSPSHIALGTGYGNFAVTFDKYFDPKFYLYTDSETYFDRAHNNVVDLASTTGAIGLLAYLSIFAAVAIYLLQGYRKNGISTHDFVLSAGLVTAYFIHNLGVFDAFVTYLMLMVFLGYIRWLAADDETPESRSKALESGQVAVLAIAGLVIVGVVYQYNIQPWRMLTYTIEGQQKISSGDYAGMLDSYKKGLALDTPLDRDSRTSLIRSVVSGSSGLDRLDREKALEIVKFTIDMAEKNVAYNQHDNINQLMLAQVYNVAAAMQGSDKEKFSFYSGLAEEAINKAIEASPGRVPVYYTKAQIFLTRGEREKAVETIEYAISLRPDYPDGYCQLARVHFYYDEKEKGLKRAESCVDMGRSSSLQPVSYARTVMRLFAEKGDFKRAIKLGEVILASSPDNPEYLVDLAIMYANDKDTTKAIELAEKIASTSPEMKSNAEGFIQSLKDGSFYKKSQVSKPAEKKAEKK